MNFRSCRYFLKVCEMGSISAAAQSLYISQQSLSELIRKMEKELGVKLFYREYPLVLTEAGEYVKEASETILGALSVMESKVAACRSTSPGKLVIGFADYGIPEFFPSLLELFLKDHTGILVQTKEIYPKAVIPKDVEIIISSRKIGGGFRCEQLLQDRLAVCVSDQLLQRQYGEKWQEHKERLENGDLHALDGCPFIRLPDTPVDKLEEMAFSANQFVPEYLPVTGGSTAASRLCLGGQAAMVSFLGQSRQDPLMPQAYAIANIPEYLPSVYICCRKDMTDLGRQFADLCRRYIKKTVGRENLPA